MAYAVEYPDYFLPKLPQMILVIITLDNLSLTLGRLRERGYLTDLCTAEVRLQDREVAEFLI